MITDHELAGVFALRVACDQAVQQLNNHLFFCTVRSVFASEQLNTLWYSDDGS